MRSRKCPTVDCRHVGAAGRCAARPQRPPCFFSPALLSDGIVATYRGGGVSLHAQRVAAVTMPAMKKNRAAFGSPARDRTSPRRREGLSGGSILAKSIRDQINCRRDTSQPRVNRRCLVLHLKSSLRPLRRLRVAVEHAEKERAGPRQQHQAIQRLHARDDAQCAGRSYTAGAP